MKRALILLLILVPCLPLVAIDFGVGVDLYASIDTEKQDASTATETDIELRPAVVMKMSPKVELRPYAVIGISNEKDPDGISGAIANDLSDPYFGAGVGLYYAFIQGEILSLLIGPKLELVFYAEPSGASAPVYERYFEADIQLALPIYLDVKLMDKLFLRGGLEIPAVQLNFWSYQQGGVSYTENSVLFLDYWPNIVPPLYFGFYYMFK